MYVVVVGWAVTKIKKRWGSSDVLLGDATFASVIDRDCVGGCQTRRGTERREPVTTTTSQKTTKGNEFSFLPSSSVLLKDDDGDLLGCSL